MSVTYLIMSKKPIIDFLTKCLTRLIAQWKYVYKVIIKLYFFYVNLDLHM